MALVSGLRQKPVRPANRRNMALMSELAPQIDAIYVNALLYLGPSSLADSERTSLLAFATSQDRIVGIGTPDQMAACASANATIIDLGGRRVIPGLIDGHMHAVRAGAQWDQELHWTGLTRITDALATIQDAVTRTPTNQWIRAVGGWHPTQFVEQRCPTRDELDAVSRDTPVYIQALYEVAVMNSAALRAVGFDSQSDNPAGGEIERDSSGQPTGVVRGMGAFTRCLAAMGTRSVAEQGRSTAVMLADLHAKGLTGIVDPGGFGMTPESYEGIQELWRHGGLTMRMRLFASAVDSGQEVLQLSDWLMNGKQRFNDDMLRLIGIGEVVHYGCHDFEGLDTAFTISSESRNELLEISRRTARAGWAMHIHAILDSSIDVVVDCWEEINQEFPLAPLRFTIIHADAISKRNIDRLAKLGVGVVVDDHLVFKAALSQEAWGEDAIRRAPPLRDLLDAGIAVAGGTDANRASSYNPWLVLWWLVAGQSLDGITRRQSDQRMNRVEALECYTIGSARLSFEESERGHLTVGALADFAVLSADYFTIPVEEIPTIVSELTVVGGKHVYSSLSI